MSDHWDANISNVASEEDSNSKTESHGNKEYVVNDIATNSDRNHSFASLKSEVPVDSVTTDVAANTQPRMSTHQLINSSTEFLSSSSSEEQLFLIPYKPDGVTKSFLGFQESSEERNEEKRILKKLSPDRKADSSIASSTGFCKCLGSADRSVSAGRKSSSQRAIIVKKITYK